MDSPLNGSVLHPGELLMMPDTPLLTGWRREPDSLVNGWARLANAADRRQFEQSLTEGGWTFFFLAGVITATAYGFNRARMLSSVTARIIHTVKQHGHNCLEIESVKLGSLLGIPYVTLSAHPRHIQKGQILSAT